MKRYVLFFLLTLLVIGSGVLGYRHLVPQGVLGSQLSYLPVTFDQLDDWGTALVVRPIRHTDSFIREIDGDIVGGLTFTEVVIKEVIRGEFSPGDKITIAEPFVPIRYPDGLYYLAQGPYLPMAEGQSYLVFIGLSADPAFDGHWFIAGGFQGKFKVPEGNLPELSTISARDVGLNFMDRDWVDNVWVKIADKYLRDMDRVE